MEHYLRDLHRLLTNNVDEARGMLALALDKIVLRRDGGRLVAQITGRLDGLLVLASTDGVVAEAGAGRGI